MPSFPRCLHRLAAAIVAMQACGVLIAVALVFVLAGPTAAEAASAACNAVNGGAINGTTTGTTNGGGENDYTLGATFIGDTFNVNQVYASGPGSQPDNSDSAIVNGPNRQVINRTGTVNYSYTTVAGDPPLTFQRAAGNGGQNVFTTTTVTCTPAPMDVTIAPASLPPAMVGVAYSQTLTASGGVAPYT